MNASSDSPVDAVAVLDFWFGSLDEQGMPSAGHMRRWFEADETLDEEIRARFTADLERARHLHAWRATARGTLALVILVDQFSRNIHRGSADAFARDDLALELTAAAIDAGFDRELRPIERLFLYMPLEHAENRDMQARSVACFHALTEEVPAPLQERFRYFASFADNHRDVIERFGRFPHRNALLGRTSTAAEIEYLEQGAPSWGQRSAAGATTESAGTKR